MAHQRHFSKEDIGAEILPILTTGLYHDPLDALREYIQNAIDANAKQIEVSIDPSIVAVVDDGHGMTPPQAERAIRLGISDKNPQQNIGFRGIGVYSAFNLCELLEIFSKPKTGRASHIVFDFAKIREELLAEQELRKRGKPPKLYLEKLLQTHVYVREDDSGVLTKPGTKVVMSNLLSENYKRLQQWDDVERYLQDVVPLPFHPGFAPGSAIQQRFTKEDYRVVPLTLEMAGTRLALYRPYRDSQFVAGANYKPKFFVLRSGRRRIGFAWVCINGRRVIKDNRIRGLLIKKFGFSVGDRGYLEPYFKRTVFNRRVTGEIIVQDPQLLPNAARSDFEHSIARQEFLKVLPRFISELSSWADKIQQSEKAREVLTEVSQELARIAEDLPLSQRDKEVMLRYNVILAELERRLTTHKKTLEAKAALKHTYDVTLSVLRRCKRAVHDALSTGDPVRQRLEQNVVKVVQAETEIKKASTEPVADVPHELHLVLDAAGISMSTEAQRALRIFESEILLGQIDSVTYHSLLKQLQDTLEEGS